MGRSRAAAEDPGRQRDFLQKRQLKRIRRRIQDRDDENCTFLSEGNGAAGTRNVDRRFVYCLICFKPSETISTHLARVCMKDKSPAERQAETLRAKTSTKNWTLEGRLWDYEEICRWCPHGPSRKGLVRELRRRQFFIVNCPADEMAEAEEVTGAARGDKPSTSADESEGAFSPLQSESESEESAAGYQSWQRPISPSSTPLKAPMEDENLHAKFPPETSTLKKFKEYLVSALLYPNSNEEVDNVSKVLRYIQPTGDDISLEFLQNTAMLKKYFKQLKRAGQSMSTRINYIKSMILFVKFIRLSHGPSDLSIIDKCSSYLEFLEGLREPMSKAVNKDTSDKRNSHFGGPKKSVSSLQKVLRDAKKDILGIFERLCLGEDVAEDERTRYRYYCEAILMLGHFQRPGAVEALPVTDWIQRVSCNGRVVVAHQTTNSQVAPFALTEDEAALIDQYYISIRPDHLKNGGDDDGPERLFVGQNGRPIKSATIDLNRLHNVYDCPNVTSQEIRRVLEIEAECRLTDEQKMDIAVYLGKTQDRKRDPVSISSTANVAQMVTGGNSDNLEGDRAALKRSQAAPEEEDFGRFQQMFPVTLDGKPPNKVSRKGAGFSENRILNDKWRAQQFKMREAHLLGKWSQRPPTTEKVQRLIQKEQWHSNCPAAENIMAMWHLPQREEVESSAALMKLVRTQRWKYLTVVEPSPRAGEGKGVVTTKSFPKNSIVCDYHGELITGAEGERRMAERGGETDYSFFFKAGTEDLCVDANDARCRCHPDADSFGRLINHSKQEANVRPVACLMKFPEGPQHVILFRALRDLEVNEEVLCDYRMQRGSREGEESAPLTWPDC